MCALLCFDTEPGYSLTARTARLAINQKLKCKAQSGRGRGTYGDGEGGDLTYLS